MYENWSHNGEECERVYHVLTPQVVCVLISKEMLSRCLLLENNHGETHNERYSCSRRDRIILMSFSDLAIHVVGFGQS